MKIILDNDGTLTDFNKFVEDNAISFFEKKYDMKVVYPDKLEIQDIFDMKNFFMQSGYDESKAEKKVNEVLDKFWVGFRFIKFSLLNRFRPGVRTFVNEMKKNGHDVQIHTSRAKTTENNMIGKFARKCTILQYYLNGVHISAKHFYFYKNDEEKKEGILESNPDLVFEDKPEIIKQLSTAGVKTICVRGKHNKEIVESKNVAIIETFEKHSLNSQIEKLFGIRNSDIGERIKKSERVFNKIKIFKPVIINSFHPIILNSQNILDSGNERILYAPNHRSTLDPLVITSIVSRNIHWAALLRFFEGRDSIFNNSKNPILCKITARMFKKLEYFPIDRKSDNPNANNFASIKDMIRFLQMNQAVGIFGEGTTRRPEGKDFGTFDESFLVLAQNTNSVIQPITTLWIRELGLKEKVIVNFGAPFHVGNMTISEEMDYFMDIQKRALKENEDCKKRLEERL